MVGGRTPAPAPYLQVARLWAPRSRWGGVEWRVLPRGAVLPYEKLRELVFLVRLAIGLGTVPGIIMYVIHLLA